jgi:hypothetical protein
MKKIIISITLLVAFTNAFSQSVERSVISSVGFSYSGAALRNDCTTGEVVTFTGQSANSDMTQGFHQPFMLSNSCPGDFDLNGVINVNDILVFAGAYGCNSNCGVTDIDGNGAVNVGDLLLLMAVFGTTCP